MALTPDTVFRDYVIDGNPSSGPWSPQKSDIIALLNSLCAIPPRNLAWVYAGPTTVTVGADDMAVFDTSGNGRRLLAVSVTPDLSVNGVNGLDTGAAAQATFYSLWVIYNPTSNTVAGLWSTQATMSALALPAGYTFARRVGWNRTLPASATLYPMIGAGARVQYVAGGGGLVQFAAGSTTVAAWSQIPISSFVPSTAMRMGLQMKMTAANGSSFQLSPNGNYPTGNNGGLFSFYHSPNDTTDLNAIVEFLLEERNFYFAFAAGSGGSYAVNCLGWEDSGAQ